MADKDISLIEQKYLSHDLHSILVSILLVFHCLLHSIRCVEAQWVKQWNYRTWITGIVANCKAKFCVKNSEFKLSKQGHMCHWPTFTSLKKKTVKKTSKLRNYGYGSETNRNCFWKTLCLLNRTKLNLHN